MSRDTLLSALLVCGGVAMVAGGLPLARAEVAKFCEPDAGHGCPGAGQPSTTACESPSAGWSCRQERGVAHPLCVEGLGSCPNMLRNCGSYAYFIGGACQTYIPGYCDGGLDHTVHYQSASCRPSQDDPN